MEKEIILTSEKWISLTKDQVEFLYNVLIYEDLSWTIQSFQDKHEEVTNVLRELLLRSWYTSENEFQKWF